jgi:D-alanyl-D-alanine dipeptidase
MIKRFFASENSCRFSEANKEFIKKDIELRFSIVIVLRYSKNVENCFNPQYVADPAKGSIHNRGGAVDITLVDTYGNELDMGNP